MSDFPAAPDKAHTVLKAHYIDLARSYGVPWPDIDASLALLAPLEEGIRLGTASHCLRVGISTGNIAHHLGEDAALAITAGSIHDIGKIGVPERFLDAKTIAPDDFRRYMIPHVDLGYRMSMELLPRQAECLKNHHRHQGDRSYGLILPPADRIYTREQKSEHWRMSRLIALADYVDAMKTRHNDRLADHELSRAERRDALYRDQSDMTKELDSLLRAHIIDLREKPRD